MATEEWLEAARRYTRLSDSARAEYWQRLTPDQQQALRDALTSSGGEVTAASVTRGQSPASARRGCGGPAAAGCLGLILGCVLTVGAEIAALMMGVQAVGNAVQELSSGGGPRSNSAPSVPPSTDSSAEAHGNPKDRAMSEHDRLRQSCGTALEFKCKEVISVCVDERGREKSREERQSTPP